MPSQRQLLRGAVVAAYGCNCFYCGSGPLHRKTLHIDRVVPCCGDDEYCVSNLRPACAACVSHKAGRSISAYVQYIRDQSNAKIARLVECENRFVTELAVDCVQGFATNFPDEYAESLADAAALAGMPD